jgi:LuxR family maltose regulon positive regulatory protein
MPDALLQTKLHIPPLRQSVVERRHLIKKLTNGLQGEDGAFARKLTLISAPAGFGKTTLVSSWIQQLDAPAAWLSLDEGDNEPNRFIYYVIAALRQVCGELTDSALLLLQSPQPPPAETLLTLIINDLADMAGQAILVLDDYHVIRELEVHKALTFLLAHQPPQLHLVIVSREDPAIPLHRLRGSGQLLGVYERELRFSTAEAAEFLDKTMGLNLTTGEVDALERRTEGWVAGLQLAALSMQDLPETRDFVATFAGDDRYIADYLLAEVVARQPVQVQEFLINTAITDRFCAALCDAILGSRDRGLGAGDVEERPLGDWGQMLSSQAIIERLDQSNLFIIPLDNKREWYRYHHLFSDYLRARLRERPASEIAELHRRAAAWYENDGQLAEAIDQALAGEDYGRASRLIEQNALTTIFGHAQWATLFKWMEALPPDLIQARPRLSVQYAWALFTTGHWEAAANLLKEIRPLLETSERTDEREWLLGELATIAALVAYSHGDVKRCTEQARQALALLPEDNLTLRCVAHLSIGESAMIQEDAPAARKSLQEAAEAALAAGNTAIALFALGDLARLELTEGYLHRAAELYERARPLGTVGKYTILGPTAIACIQMGAVLCEWNELEEAESLLRKGLTLCQGMPGLPNIVLEAQIILANVLLAGGDEQEAAETLGEAETLLTNLLGRSGDPQPMISVALANRLRFWIARRELDAAARWLATNGISVDSAISPGELTYHVLLARILIGQGHLDQAQKQLQKLEKVVAERGSPRLAVELSTLRALWLDQQGERDQAIEMIIGALRLAEPEGFVRLFVDFGEPIAPLLKQAAGHEPAPPKAKAILDVMAAGQPATAVPIPEASILLEPLRDQELRILRLMAAGLSNREIADELFLSVNTIKVYVSRIYGKLGVHKRGQAVARAQELGLI